MESGVLKFVIRGIAVILICLFAVLSFRWILPAVIPFGISFVISTWIRPLSARISKRFCGSQKTWAVVLLILSAAVIFSALWYVTATLSNEVREAALSFGRMITDSQSPIRLAAGKMMETVKSLGFSEDSLQINLSQMAGSAATYAAEAAAGFVGRAVSYIPSFFLFFVVLILSLFYFSCDFENMKKGLFSYIPERIRKKLSDGVNMGLSALGKFAKAYLLLFLITLGVLTLGFFLIGTRYPLLSGILTAFVDLLPVLGVGTVLLPWAIFLFLAGETSKGAGMLVLLCVMYVLRQILEPRIVGSAVGVHPAAVLFSVYLGFKLCGVGGMLAAPLILNCVGVFLEEKRKKLVAQVDKEM